LKKYVLIACVAITALVVAAPAAAASHARQADAHIAKKCKKKHGKKRCKKSIPAPVVTPPAPPAPPAPLALTSSEVINQVIQKAGQYCAVDPYCFDWGYYYVNPDPNNIACASKSTYSWSCYGWNDEDNGVDPVFTCDFREIVERTGYSGITSHQDLSYGSSGWNCHT
jgi:hypothetical protein